MDAHSCRYSPHHHNVTRLGLSAGALYMFCHIYGLNMLYRCMITCPHDIFERNHINIYILMSSTYKYTFNPYAIFKRTWCSLTESTLICYIIMKVVWYIAFTWRLLSLHIHSFIWLTFARKNIYDTRTTYESDATAKNEPFSKCLFWLRSHTVPYLTISLGVYFCVVVFPAHNIGHPGAMAKRILFFTALSTRMRIDATRGSGFQGGGGNGMPNVYVCQTKVVLKSTISQSSARPYPVMDANQGVRRCEVE